MFSLMNDMNEGEREREREWGDREKGEKVEIKDRRSSIFGNCIKI